MLCFTLTVGERDCVFFVAITSSRLYIGGCNHSAKSAKYLASFFLRCCRIGNAKDVNLCSVFKDGGKQ